MFPSNKFPLSQNCALSEPNEPICKIAKSFKTFTLNLPGSRSKDHFIHYFKEEQGRKNWESRRPVQKISTLPYEAVINMKKLLNTLRCSLNCLSKIRDVRSQTGLISPGACTGTSGCMFCLFKTDEIVSLPLEQ